MARSILLLLLLAATSPASDPGRIVESVLPRGIPIPVDSPRRTAQDPCRLLISRLPVRDPPREARRRGTAARQLSRRVPVLSSPPRFDQTPLLQHSLTPRTAPQPGRSAAPGTQPAPAAEQSPAPGWREPGHPRPSPGAQRLPGLSRNRRPTAEEIAPIAAPAP